MAILSLSMPQCTQKSVLQILRIRTQAPAICMTHLSSRFSFFYFLFSHKLPLCLYPVYIWMIIILGTPEWLSSRASSFISGCDLRSCDPVPYWAPSMEHTSPSACISASLCVSLMDDYHSGEHGPNLMLSTWHLQFFIVYLTLIMSLNILVSP